jgi:hypothetical protein
MTAGLSDAPPIAGVDGAAKNGVHGRQKWRMAASLMESTCSARRTLEAATGKKFHGIKPQVNSIRATRQGIVVSERETSDASATFHQS